MKQIPKDILFREFRPSAENWKLHVQRKSLDGERIYYREFYYPEQILTIVHPEQNPHGSPYHLQNARMWFFTDLSQLLWASKIVHLVLFYKKWIRIVISLNIYVTDGPMV